MSENFQGKLTHASPDLPSRWRKGQKIERLLELPISNGRLRLLEVGAGSGGVCHYFTHGAAGSYEVHAADVVDSRQSNAGYEFSLVQGTQLPYLDAEFDITISNHVIEHVGAEIDQLAHLAELRRVMKMDGVGYLAVPNRWMLIEPHYRLALLSWWPEWLRTPWLRLWRRGLEYDCRPLSRRQLESMLTRTGFAFEQLHAKALRAFIETEPASQPWLRLAATLPDGLFHGVRGVFPTLIYRLRKS